MRSHQGALLLPQETWLTIAGTMSLIVGLAFIGLGGLAAAAAGIRFDGLLDTHFVPAVPVWLPVVEGMLNGVVISALLALVVRLFGSGSGVRFIDVAGTQALARSPLAPVAAICTIPWFRDALAQTSSAVETAGSLAVGPGAIVGILFVLAGTVWMVVLMWKAFSVACNMKGKKGAALFMAALVIGESVTKIVVMNYL